MLVKKCLLNNYIYIYIYLFFLQILIVLMSLELVLGPLYLTVMFVMAPKLSCLNVDLMKENSVTTIRMLASDVIVVRKLKFIFPNYDIKAMKTNIQLLG